MKSALSKESIPQDLILVLVVEEISDKNSVYLIADRIIKSLIMSYEIAGNQIRIGASIGVVFYPEDGKTQVTIQRKADERIYEAKALGGNRFK